MVSVTCRLTTGVTETAGGGAPWAAATPQEAAKLSAQTAAFQATQLRPGIEVLLIAGLYAYDTPIFSNGAPGAMPRPRLCPKYGHVAPSPGRKRCSRRGPHKR